MHSRQYLFWLGGTILMLAIFSVLLTILVDPYRMFGTPVVPGWTELKPHVYEQVGIAKTYQLERIAPKTVLLGNSRVEIGLDPASPEWPADARPVFNAAEAGRDLFTALLMLREAIAAGRLRTAVIGVDFQDFLQRNYSWTAELPPIRADERRLLVDRNDRPNPDRTLQMWRDRISSTLTIDVVIDSLKTLLDQDAHTTTMTPLGFNPLQEYQVFVERSGYFGLFAHANATYRRQYRSYLPPDFSHPSGIAEYRYLLLLIHLAKAHGVGLIVFTPPYHADYLEMLHRLGLWASFESWQRTLADTVDAAKQRGVNISLFDFSGYNPVTTEPVPPPDDRTSQMRWYWEPGHYKSALGDKMLKRFFHNDESFGYVLTKANVNTLLVWTRSQRAEYARRIKASGSPGPAITDP